MRKSPEILIQHILESIAWIEKDIKDLNEDEFYENIPIQDAILRRIEIIGEAVKSLPADLKDYNPKVPWLDIANMRNKLIHEYFEVDLELVWEVIKKDIPELKKNLRELIT